MWDQAGPFRTGEKLTEALARMGEKLTRRTCFVCALTENVTLISICKMGSNYARC